MSINTILSAVSTDAVFLWTAAVVYALAAGSIMEHIRRHKLSILTSFPIYFVTVSFYFVLAGVQQYIDVPALTVAMLVIMTFGAITLLSFPFQLENPKYSKVIYSVLFTAALGSVLYSFVMNGSAQASQITMIIAMSSTIIVALYMLAAAIHSPKIRSKSTSLAVLLIFNSAIFGAHVFFQRITFPVFGTVVGLPFVSALISIMSLIFALYLNKYIR